MDEREFVIILSDIHMGTTAPTVWYRNEVHEKYLTAIFDDIIICANRIREVILLGDIFEFWAYSPDELPPMLEDIIAVHPNILGHRGKLCQALSALKGRIIYIPGDHDMNITQADLNKIKSPDGYTIKYHAGDYIPSYDNGILFTHGHELTLLNAPYLASQLAPLPIGYFITRAISYKVQKILSKMPGFTIADLEEYGAYGHAELLSKIPHFLKNYVNGLDFVSKFVDAIAYSTGIPKDLQIKVNKTTTVSLNEVKKIYLDYFHDFHRLLIKQGITDKKNQLDILADELNKTFLSKCVMNNGFGSFIDTVVMAHTHLPMTYRKEMVDYVNTGFMCPSIPNMRTKPITYGIYSITNRFVRLMEVTGNTHVSIQPYKEENLWSPKDNGNVISSYKKSISNVNIRNRHKYHTYDLGKAELNLIHKLNNTKNVTDNRIEINQNGIISDQRFTFGWSVYDASLEFFLIMQMGVLSKAEELGIDIITHDENSNSIEMVTGSIDLISKGINALLIAPFNPELLPVVVADAKRYEIPVIAIDVGTGGADVAAFIVSDNYGGGIFAGEYALILIDKYSIVSTNVAIIKVQESGLYALLRGRGFRSVMEENGYTVVAEVPANSERLLAYEVMNNILATYGNDLAVVFCENGPMTLGAAQAIDEAGKKGEIMLIGFDSGPSIIEGIMNGSIQGTIAQEPYKMGEIGVEIANFILQGIPVTYDDWTEKLILMEVYLIDEYGVARINIQ